MVARAVEMVGEAEESAAEEAAEMVAAALVVAAVVVGRVAVVGGAVKVEVMAAEQDGTLVHLEAAQEVVVHMEVLMAEGHPVVEGMVAVGQAMVAPVAAGEAKAAMAASGELAAALQAWKTVGLAAGSGGVERVVARMVEEAMASVATAVEVRAVVATAEAAWVAEVKVAVGATAVGTLEAVKVVA